MVVCLAAKFCAHPWAVACGGLSAALRHCYPVFAHFRGGKAVATMYGFLFGLWVCIGYPPYVFFLPLVTILIALFLFKIVALSSMVSALAAVIYIWSAGAHASIISAITIFAILGIIRQRDNILRMFRGAENKIRWM